MGTIGILIERMMDLHIIPVDAANNPDKFIIYRPLLGLAFVGNRALADLAQAALADESIEQANAGQDGAAHAFLQRIGFLQPDPPSPPPTATTFRPTTAVLLMTNRCQLRCIYCYAAAGELPAETLTREQGYAAIDYVCQNAVDQKRPRFELSFHGGGEPTMAWSVLQDCTAYARERPLPAKITLTSNGIWSRQQRDWILANIDGLTLSLDGAPETQNKQRPFASGRGSADQIMDNLAELDRRQFSYGIRMTATPPFAAFVAGVRFICEETGCRSIQVEPAFNTERGEYSYPDEADCLAFADAFMQALEIATQAGRRLMYSGARLGLVTSSFCTAPYNALIINPAGRLVACYEVTGTTHPLAQLSAIGQFADGQMEVTEPARAHLHGLIAERRQACRDCFCYWSCAGDCYTRTFQDTHNGHQVRGARCTMNQAITRQMLLYSIADTDGIWRRQPAAHAHQLVSEAITI
jgi:uncharacterized protein